MIILATAWRNLWRQKRRTFLTIGAISVTTALLIFSISIQIGSYQMMIDSSLKISDGFGRIQHKDYADTPTLRNSITDLQAVKTSLKKGLKQVEVGAKILSYGIISTEQRSLGAQIIGGDADFEKNNSLMARKIVEGHFYSSDATSQIVMGQGLADNLKVKLNDEVTFLATDKQGSLAVDSFKVIGLFRTGMKEIDNNLLMINLPYLQQLLALEDQAHQIVITGETFMRVTEQLPLVKTILQSRSDLTVMDWKAIQPGLYNAIQLDMGSAIPIYLVLIIVVCFGFMNTMFMTVYERTREFGMLMAIGMRPGLISRMFFVETLLILAFGFLGGIVLGMAGTEYFVINGVFIEGTEVIYEQFGLPPTIYPSLSWYTVLPAPILTTLFTLLATILPILRIRRMNIIDSMRAVK